MLCLWDPVVEHLVLASARERESDPKQIYRHGGAMRFMVQPT